MAKKNLGLEGALSKLHKAYGDDSINKMKDTTLEDVQFLSTGSISIDAALGGGFAQGRIAVIKGMESGGKTTLALQTMAEAQKEGKMVAFLDMEHAMDPEYASNLGVDMEELIFAQPGSGEECIEMVETLADCGEVSLIVIDSVASLVPLKVLEGAVGDANIALTARLLSQNIPKIAVMGSATNCAVIFINQIRMKVGVVFGSPETEPGGLALKFGASQIIDVRKATKIKEGSTDVIAGNKVRIHVTKNKVAPPFKKCEVDIFFGKGFYRPAEVLTLGVDLGVVKKSGSWFSYDGTNIGQGFTGTLAVLEDNPELLDEIHALVKAEIIEG